jgi:hypothetical protein
MGGGTYKQLQRPTRAKPSTPLWETLARGMSPFANL